MANRSSFTAQNGYTPDVFRELFELSPSQLTQAKRYQELKMKTNKTSIEVTEYNNLIKALQDYLITAERWNHFQDALVNMQNYIRNSVFDHVNKMQTDTQNYVNTKQTEMNTYADSKKTEVNTFVSNKQAEINATASSYNTHVDTKKSEINTIVSNYNTYVDTSKTDMTTFVSDKKTEVNNYINTETTKFDNKLNRLSYKGDYNSSTQYYQWNTVKYEGSTYLAIQDSIGKAPNLVEYWAKMADKGSKGDQGLAGIGLTFRGAYSSSTTYNPEDAVEYNGSVYFCVSTSVGEVPTIESPSWDLFLNKGSIIVSSVTPSLPTNHSLWINISDMYNMTLNVYDTLTSSWKQVGVTKEYVDGKIGILNELTTTEKTNLVNAINEVANDVQDLETNKANSTDFTTLNTTVATHLANNARHNSYGTSNTGTTVVAKVVTSNGFTLATGAHIAVKFTNGNTALAPTLNVNSTGAIPIYQNGTADATWSPGEIIEFVYDDTNFCAITSSSQQVNEITAKLVEDLPSTYPRGISTFNLTTTTSVPWRDAVGETGLKYGVVETTRGGNGYVIQRLTLLYTADSTTPGVFQREGYSSTWRSWKKVIDSADIITGTQNFNSTTGRVISHSIGHTNYEVSITPTQNPNGYLGEVWVEKAMNSFSVKSSGTATTTFDYVVFKY